MIKKNVAICCALAVVTFIGCSGKEGLTGPQGERGMQGEQGPQGPQGESGNTDVTVYLFDAHDFSETSYYNIEPDISFGEFKRGSSDIYLIMQTIGYRMYEIPGWGRDKFTYYHVEVFSVYDTTKPEIKISVKEGPGEYYEEVIIVFKPAGNVVDNRTSSPKMKPLNSLDEIIGYYGISPENIIDKRTKLN